MADLKKPAACHLIVLIYHVIALCSDTIESLKVARMIRFSKLCLMIACSISSCVLLTGCVARKANLGPSVKFTKVPYAAEGGPDRMASIEGRALRAHPGQRIVLFAQSGPWWVQPLYDHPFTEIQPDSTWSGQTHFGTKYAALLVDPGYQPQPKIDSLPSEGAGVVAVAVTDGRPPFWQTWWFISLSIALLMVLVVSAYSYRLREVEKEFRARLEERVSERTRIARDLHDTLLQSFQGLLLSFQTVYDLLPARSTEAKETLGNAINEAADAIMEGRDAIQGLRVSTVETNELALAIGIIREELATDEANRTSAAFRVEVEGTQRNLNPILRDEVYRIAGEALRNAFRHAQAKQIEVEIHYDDRQFRLSIRDDGKGIAPEMLAGNGFTGHYGLHGMRERAKVAGGKLAVWSALDSGTEVELTIPALTAYGISPRRSWWCEKFSAKGTAEKRLR